MKKTNNQKGFTLIEMVVVMVLISALAAIAMPRYQNYRLKAKAAEAANILGALVSEAEAARETYGSYASIDNDSQAIADANSRGQNFNYSAAINGNSLTLTATGLGDLGSAPNTSSLSATLNGTTITWENSGLCLDPSAL